ncbi:mycofactocin oligosaccharide methyltransferase MftM [Actinomadura keratinilytica]|jgi:SAM-dependent methyltransferase|uniref:Mycofactocin oligosaccharide methyltransferase MftM n=1 Tax=Actinomadura keratinilytica TaxID=547461 RepID=A0ABP7Z4C6_9ACTN
MKDPAQTLAAAAHRIDPLAPHPPGVYADHLVRVVRIAPPRDDAGDASAAAPAARTEHFLLRRRGRRIEIDHWLPAERLDNDLAGLLADELFAPGWLSGPDIFERVFTGIVRTCVDGPLTSWCAFYANTLARIRTYWHSPDPSARSSIAEFAPVYQRALDLVPPGAVLDVGSCFGFLPLLLAERATGPVIASDLSGSTMRLLAAVADALGLRLDTLTCDAVRVPLPDGCVDTVTAVHVLEHMDEAQGEAVVREALRLARRRVVVAVPYEEEPTAAYGHVRVFDRAALTALGRAAADGGRRCGVDDHHGGWLVIDAG